MKRTRIASVSAKRARVNRARRKVSERLYEERGPFCELRTAVCTVSAEACHELVGRAQGGSLTDERNLVLACNRCNGHVEDEPSTAREAGWKCPRAEATVGVGGLVPSYSWRIRHGRAT